MEMIQISLKTQAAWFFKKKPNVLPRLVNADAQPLSTHAFDRVTYGMDVNDEVPTDNSFGSCDQNRCM